jgi:hypothetical protein
MPLSPLHAGLRCTSKRLLKFNGLPERLA